MFAAPPPYSSNLLIPNGVAPPPPPPNAGDVHLPPPPTYQGSTAPPTQPPIRHHHTCSIHSRTSSATSVSALVSRSPLHEGTITHRSQDDILSMSQSATIAYFENGGSCDPRYMQLLTEYRRLLQSATIEHPSTPGTHSTIHHGRAPSWGRFPPVGDFGPQAAAHWHSSPNFAAAPPPPPHNPTTPTSVLIPDATSVLSAPSSPMPSFTAANPDTMPPSISAAMAPTAPSTSSSKGPLTPQQKASSSASKLSAPPQSASGSVARKVSKRQLEAEEENMSKDAKIAHLERLLQIKDERIAKLEGDAAELLDSACQATVWTNSVRTQTGEVGHDDGDDRSNMSPSSSDAQSGVLPKRGDVLELQSLIVECGFTTLRPLAIQLMGADCTSSALVSVTIPSSVRGGGGTTLEHGQQLTTPSPKPRWAHCPYPLTKKNSTGQMSAGELSQGDASMELLAPLPSSHRWADDPCDFELQPASSMNSGPTAPLSPHTRLGNSMNSLQLPTQKSDTPVISRGGSATGAWRGGSRAQARQGSVQAQTL
mmetsp:Transcript_81945/g.95731  ORF Transcript_81945/g.95731 Transcript_81945/m.95731 type:complete len:538 (+) Transcript_81945:233-1846(+)